MGNFGESISAILSKVAQILGLKPSEKHRLDQMFRKLDIAKASNEDRLEALKEKIKLQESKALIKKKELDSARGNSKRIVAGEIERLFRDLDRLHGQEGIIASNIERVSIAREKFDELKAAQDSGVEEGQLDDIALDLQEAISGLKVADREVSDLEQVEYEPPQRKHVDVESRMAEVQGEEVTTTGLSPETEERLKQLESEET